MKAVDLNTFAQFIERTIQNAGTTVKTVSVIERPEGAYIALFAPWPGNLKPSPLIAERHYALRRDYDEDNAGYITRCACGGWFCDFEKHLSEHAPLVPQLDEVNHD